MKRAALPLALLGLILFAVWQRASTPGEEVEGRPAPGASAPPKDEGDAPPVALKPVPDGTGEREAIADRNARAEGPHGVTPSAGSGPPLLTGRVLDVAGEPVVDTHLHAMVDRDGARLRGQPLRLDGEGRFAWGLANLPRPLEGMRFTVIMREARAIRWVAEARIPELDDGARHDLGDLRLREHAGSIVGRAVDVEGRLIDDEDIEVAAFDAAGRRIERCRARGGVFALDCLVSGEVELRAETDTRFQRDELRARAGDEVVVVLVEGGVISGSLGFGEQHPRGAFAVRAAPAGTEERGRYGGVEEDGRFRIYGLPSGRYRFELVRSELPLLTVQDIEVVLAKTTRDPRLENIHLAALVRPIAILVCSEAGSPIDGAYVDLEQGGALARERTEDGRCTHWLPAEGTARLLVSAERYRPEIVDPALEDLTIVLKPGIPLELQSDRRVVQDEGATGAQLRLRLEASHAGPAWLHDVDLPMHFGAGDPLHVVFPAPGVYRLHVRVLRRFGTYLGVSPGDRFVATDTLLEVREGDARSRLWLAMPADLFQFASGR